MLYSFLLQRFALFVILLLSLGARPGAAQTTRRYPDRVADMFNTFNSGAATGNSPSTQATLAPPALFGTASLKLGFPATNPAGSKAGLVVDSGGLLALAAFSGLVINTYLAPSTTPQESVHLSQLLTLQVLNSGPAAAEFTTTKPFDQVELAAGGLVNAYSLGLVLAYADVPTPLPVELVAFGGLATPAGVELSWQTASERHNSYFAVERAADSLAAAFVELRRVIGAGSSSQAHSYQFVDAAPYPLGYYRLRQVDTNGQAHYSPVVAVRGSQAAALATYPNPATSTLFIASPGAARRALFNSQGQLVRQIALAAGQQRLDVSNLPAGIYYLRDAATGQSTRFVKVGSQ